MPTELAHGLQVMSVCNGFAAAGAEVLLLLPRRFNPHTRDPFAYYGISRTFSVRYLPCIDLIPWLPSNFFFWLETITFLISARIYLWFRSYDILYTREQAVGFFFPSFMLELHLMPRRVRSLHLFIWKKAEQLVVLTSFIKEKLVHAGIDSDKIIVAPDGLDPVSFHVAESQTEARQKLSLPASASSRLIGYVGMLRTLGMEKGIDTALEALTLLPPDVILVLVGGYTADIAFYKARAEELSLADRVRFIGRVSHAEVPLYLAACDVLIAPFPENEHYSFYMSPMKIFEYMGSHRPIVTTNLPSLREILSDKEAVFVPPGDAEGLAGGIQEVLDNPASGVALAEAAFQLVGAYSWEARAKKILETACVRK